MEDADDDVRSLRPSQIQEDRPRTPQRTLDRSPCPPTSAYEPVHSAFAHRPSRPVALQLLRYRRPQHLARSLPAAEDDLAHRKRNASTTTAPDLRTSRAEPPGLLPSLNIQFPAPECLPLPQPRSPPVLPIPARPSRDPTLPIQLYTLPCTGEPPTRTPDCTRRARVSEQHPGKFSCRACHRSLPLRVPHLRHHRVPSSCSSHLCSSATCSPLSRCRAVLGLPIIDSYRYVAGRRHNATQTAQHRSPPTITHHGVALG